MFVVSLSNRLLFGRLAKESIKENSIVMIAVIIPKLIVLNDRVSNSMISLFEFDQYLVEPKNMEFQKRK